MLIYGTLKVKSYLNDVIFNPLLSVCPFLLYSVLFLLLIKVIDNNVLFINGLQLNIILI